MAYRCEIHPGQYLYLDNSGHQTQVTLQTTGAGQQQQSSTSFQTGPWTQVPMILRGPSGVFVRVVTAQGDRYIQVQGSSMSLSVGTPIDSHPETLPVQSVEAMPSCTLPGLEPMQPMQPMQPMTMGNMAMGLEPMQMRMGNMAMSMGKASPPVATPTTIQPPVAAVPSQELGGGQRRFCSQCGAAVQPTDRFCSSCGHQLG